MNIRSKVMTIANALVGQGVNRSAAMVRAWITVKMKQLYDCELRRNELHVKGFGGFYIKTDTNEWYCFSKSGNNGGKNAVNCLMEMLGMDLKTAISELSGCSMFALPIIIGTISLRAKRKNLRCPNEPIL